MMKERPILFSAPMVQAILAGRKTQTRRAVKGKWLPLVEKVLSANGKWVWDTLDYELTTPYGKPGDRLWVKETWSHTGTGVWRICDVAFAHDGGFIYAADGKVPGAKYWPSIHMLRRASRILLEIVDIRVEQLSRISKADTIAEGVSNNPTPGTTKIPWGIAGIPTLASGFLDPRHAFMALWNFVNGPDAWDDDPLVWVIEFKRVVP